MWDPDSSEVKWLVELLSQPITDSDLKSPMLLPAKVLYQAEIPVSVACCFDLGLWVGVDCLDLCPYDDLREALTILAPYVKKRSNQTRSKRGSISRSALRQFSLQCGKRPLGNARLLNKSASSKPPRLALPLTKRRGAASKSISKIAKGYFGTFLQPRARRGKSAQHRFHRRRWDGTTEEDEMTIKDATDFWQAVLEAGYAMEGESRGYERQTMARLSKALEEYLREHPVDTTSDAGFAMISVARLAGAFAFNDWLVPRKDKIIDAVMAKVSSAKEGNETQH
jgi:hypothetical protein